MKDRLRDIEGVSEISMNSEKLHISIWTLFMASSMKVALHMDPNYAKNLEMFMHSAFGNIESFILCYEHDDCRIFRNKEHIPQRFREPIVGKVHIAY